MDVLEGDDSRQTALYTPTEGGATNSLTRTYVSGIVTDKDRVRSLLENSGLSAFLDLLHTQEPHDGGSDVKVETPPNLEQVLGRLFRQQNHVRHVLKILLQEPTPKLNFNGRFCLMGELGKGGQGIVQLAVDFHADPPHLCVIKSTLAPEANLEPWSLARFKREWKILERLNGQHVPRLIEHGMSPGSTAQERFPYFAMELILGYPLGKIAAGDPFPQEAAVKIIRIAARALQKIHRDTGGPHRDIKPDNLILADDGSLKVIDFGLAALAEVESSADATTREYIQRITKSGVGFGTPQYMAPEQMGDAGKVDIRADIYSLGIILYELLTGRNPFSGQTVAHTLSLQQHFEPDFLIFKNRELTSVLQKMLQKNAKCRFDDMNQVDIALGKICPGDPEVLLQPVAMETVESDRAHLFSKYPSADAMRKSLLGNVDMGESAIADPGQMRRFVHDHGTRRNFLRLLFGTAVVGGIGGLGYFASQSSKKQQKHESLEEQLRNEGLYPMTIDVDEREGLRRLVLPYGVELRGEELAQIFAKQKGQSAERQEWVGAFVELSREQQLRLLGLVGPNTQISDEEYAKLPATLLHSLRMHICSQVFPDSRRFTLVSIMNIGSFVSVTDKRAEQCPGKELLQFYSSSLTMGSAGALQTHLDRAFPSVRDYDQSLLLSDVRMLAENLVKMELTSEPGPRYTEILLKKERIVDRYLFFINGMLARGKVLQAKASKGPA